jgi:hypothetical protein
VRVPWHAQSARICRRGPRFGIWSRSSRATRRAREARRRSATGEARALLGRTPRPRSASALGHRGRAGAIWPRRDARGALSASGQSGSAGCSNAAPRRAECCRRRARAGARAALTPRRAARSAVGVGPERERGLLLRRNAAPAPRGVLSASGQCGSAGCSYVATPRRAGRVRARPTAESGAITPRAGVSGRAGTRSPRRSGPGLSLIERNGIRLRTQCVPICPRVLEWTHLRNARVC